MPLHRAQSEVRLSNLRALWQMSSSSHGWVQGVDHDGLLFEARSTFISMAERFDGSRKARLTTFAWAQIMSNLQRLCESEGALLPMSVSANRDTSKLERAENDLSQQTGRSPSLAEAAAKVPVLLDACNGTRCTVCTSLSPDVPTWIQG